MDVKNFQNFIIQFVPTTKTTLWLKIERLAKNNQGCAINSYRSSVQESNICFVSETHLHFWLDGLLEFMKKKTLLGSKS